MKYLSIILVFLSLCIGGDKLVKNAIADTHIIGEIIVTGNNRIEDATIINYSGLKKGDTYSKLSIDTSLKNLYQTELFSDVEIAYENTKLVISVVEHYTINLVAFEGNIALSDQDLSNVAKLTARSTFSRIRLEEDIANIISAYRSAGRFSVLVDPKIIKLEYNTINLVFEIKEGPTTKITDINFIGNQNYTDRALRSVIQSKRGVITD